MIISPEVLEFNLTNMMLSKRASNDTGLEHP